MPTITTSVMSVESKSFPVKNTKRNTYGLEINIIIRYKRMFFIIDKTGFDENFYN